MAAQFPTHSVEESRFGVIGLGRIWNQHRGVETSDGVVWFWIGTHAEYDNLTD